MGKKINHRVQKTQKGEKKDVKELQPTTRTQMVNLHKMLHKVTFKNKAPQAVKRIKNLASRTMFTQDNRIDPALNQQLWRNGVRNVDRRVEVVMERKKVEDDEDNTNDFYTLIRLA